MVLKHSAMYLLARGLPGVINFIAIVIYTRLLTPDDYGCYALIVAGVGLFNMVFFQWLRLSLLRFLPAHLEKPALLLSTILVAFSSLALLTGGLGILLALLWPDPTWRGLMLLAVPLLWAQAWFELNLELARSKLQPLRYGLISGLKAVSAVGLGILLILWGLGAFGPLIGLLLGMLAAGLGLNWKEWSGLQFALSKSLILHLMRFGLPLTASFALGFVVSTSDRFLIRTFLDNSAVGVYAAGYDIAQNSLTLLMMIVNLAAYPLLMRTLEQKGIAATQEQARKNAILIMVVAIPASAGLAALAPNIAAVMLGEAFRDQTVLLLPVIALAALIAGAKSYYFDVAFQLGRWTVGQVWVLGVAALINIVLNLCWIPLYGIQGAAYATVAAYGVGLMLSAVWGRKVFIMPFPSLDFLRIVGASVIMVLVLWTLFYTIKGIIGLLIQISMGIIVYGLSCMMLNVAGSRVYVLALLKRRM